MQKPEDFDWLHLKTFSSYNKGKSLIDRLHKGSGLWRLTPLSTIFHLYCWSVLLVEETRVPGEKHRPASSH